MGMANGMQLNNIRKPSRLIRERAKLDVRIHDLIFRFSCFKNGSLGI